MEYETCKNASGKEKKRKCWAYETLAYERCLLFKEKEEKITMTKRQKWILCYVLLSLIATHQMQCYNGWQFSHEVWYCNMYICKCKPLFCGSTAWHRPEISLIYKCSSESTLKTSVTTWISWNSKFGQHLEYFVENSFFLHICLFVVWTFWICTSRDVDDGK